MVQLAGCQSPSSQYLMNGIGAELPARDMKRAATLQNAYFNYLCQQAGLVDGSFTDKPGNCTIQPRDESGWMMIVRQGMNDIDRRCDAYLEWLDNKQRSAGPLRNQLRDLQGAVQGIMFAVDPGSTAALEIVGLAFGLIDRSLQNYNSRLLDLVEPSTRNSVVLNALRDFRHQMNERRLQFGTRPDAEYALREYMRRCLPFAIEAQINDLSTLGSQGVSPKDATTIFEAPVDMGSNFNARPSAPSTLTNIEPVRPPRGAPESAISEDEKRIGRPEVKAFQGVLCVDSDGEYGPITRANIVLFQDVTGNRAQLKSSPGVLDKRDIGILRKGKKCKAPNGNYFESVNLSSDLIRSIAKKLKEDFPEVDEGSSLSELRPFIKEKRRRLGLDNGPNGVFSDQLTPDLVALLFVTE
jgi:hypothetical protein